MTENEKKQKITADMTMEERWECYRSTIAELTIMSDIFARNVLKEKTCTEYLLETILGEEKVTVLEQVLQMDYKNLQGRSAILDCVARDRKNRIVNIEIQNEGEGASPERARYHSGLMDMNTLNPGQDFDELPESYMIFITRDDVLGYELPIYHIDRIIKEVKDDFMDEAHIIYVNARRQDDTELGRLMHDLHCKNAKDMYSKVLADRVYELKETQEGIAVMCKEMDEIYNDGMNRGIEYERKNTERERDRANRAEAQFYNVARLTTLLLKSGRIEECLRAVNDEEYQQKLMEEMHIA